MASTSYQLPAAGALAALTAGFFIADHSGWEIVFGCVPILLSYFCFRPGRFRMFYIVCFVLLGFTRWSFIGTNEFDAVGDQIEVRQATVTQTGRSYGNTWAQIQFDGDCWRVRKVELDTMRGDLLSGTVRRSSKGRHGCYNGTLVRGEITYSDTLARRNVERVGSTAGGVINALLWADRSLLPTQWTESFRDAGILHLLAVSGFHFGFFIATIWWLSSLLLLSPATSSVRKYRIMLMIAALFAYAMAMQSTPSVMRASFVATAILIAGLLPIATPHPLNLLGAFGLVLGIVSPELLTSLGMQLSLGITLVLVTHARAIHRLGGSVWRKSFLSIQWLVLPTIVSIVILGFNGINATFDAVLNNIFAIPIFGVALLPSVWVSQLLIALEWDYVALVVADFAVFLVDFLARFSIRGIVPGTGFAAAMYLVLWAAGLMVLRNQAASRDYKL